MKTLATSDDPKKRIASHKAMLRAAKALLRAKLGYLKARRWRLLDVPDRLKVAKHVRELALIAQDEEDTIRGGIPAIIQEGVRNMRQILTSSEYANLENEIAWGAARLDLEDTNNAEN